MNKLKISEDVKGQDIDIPIWLFFSPGRLIYHNYNKFWQNFLSFKVFGFPQLSSSSIYFMNIFPVLRPSESLLMFVYLKENALHMKAVFR